MFTHSAHSTPAPRGTPSPAELPAKSTLLATTEQTQDQGPTKKRKRATVERIPTPPRRTRAKTRRFASEEARKAEAADEQARKNAKTASKKAAKDNHSQRMRTLKASEVLTISILLSFYVLRAVR
jgi:uncharacterized protein YaiL (DUF2058 family)